MKADDEDEEYATDGENDDDVAPILFIIRVFVIYCS